jgi:hypothetical protein
VQPSDHAAGIVERGIVIRQLGASRINILVVGPSNGEVVPGQTTFLEF